MHALTVWVLSEILPDAVYHGFFAETVFQIADAGAVFPDCGGLEVAMALKKAGHDQRIVKFFYDCSTVHVGGHIRAGTYG